MILSASLAAALKTPQWWRHPLTPVVFSRNKQTPKAVKLDQLQSNEHQAPCTKITTYRKVPICCFSYILFCLPWRNLEICNYSKQIRNIQHCTEQIVSFNFNNYQPLNDRPTNGNTTAILASNRTCFNDAVSSWWPGQTTTRWQQLTASTCLVGSKSWPLFNCKKKHMKNKIDAKTWVFPKIGVPQNGWLGGSPIFGNTHMWGLWGYFQHLSRLLFHNSELRAMFLRLGLQRRPMHFPGYVHKHVRMIAPSF